MMLSFLKFSVGKLDIKYKKGNFMRQIVLVFLLFNSLFCVSTSKHEEMKKELDIAQDIVASLTKERDSLKQVEDLLKKELEESKQREGLLVKELDTYKQQEAALKRELQNSHGSDKTIKQELEFCNQTLESLEQEIEANKKIISEQEAKLALVQKRDVKVKRIIKKLRDLNRSLKAKLREKDMQIELTQAESNKRKLEAEQRLLEYKELIKKFQSFMDSGSLKIKMLDGRIHVVLPSDVLFASGQANLNSDGLKNIREITKILASIPDKKYQVEGHTDNFPINTRQFPSNWELASIRALNVVKEMVKAGMPPERISGASFGEHKPIAPNTTREGRSLNRRIDIVILPDLTSLPGYKELNQLDK
jgi:chemotaxis protein MotB